MELYEESGMNFHIAFVRSDRGDEDAMAARWGGECCTFLDFRAPALNIEQRFRRKLNHLLRRPSLFQYSIDDSCDKSLIASVNQLAKRLAPRCVQIEYAFLTKLFECFDDSVFKILDTIEILSQAQRELLALGLEPHWSCVSKNQEIIGLNRADSVLAIQPADAESLREMTNKPVVTVGHIVNLSKPKVPETSVPTAIFLGSANAFNKDALRYLLEESPNSRDSA